MFSVRAKSTGGIYDSTPVSFIWTAAVPLVLIDLNAYTSFLDVYTGSSDNSTLKIKGMEFSDIPIFDRPVKITIKGGHDSVFNSVGGSSKFQGTVTIAAGAITFDEITIQ